MSSLVYEQGLSTFNIWQLRLKDFKRSEKQAFVLISAVGYVVINTVIDVLYGVIDPRVRIRPVNA